jgi:hypothetical protein
MLRHTAPVKYLIVIALTAALLSCATPPTATIPGKASTGAGSSFATAIIVPVTNEMAGVRFEHDYIRSHYPGSRFISQSLSQHGGKPYDITTFASADGKEHSLYFDISRYFGRF